MPRFRVYFLAVRFSLFGLVHESKVHHYDSPATVSTQLLFFNTIFVSSHMYPQKGTQVIIGSMNMGYISDTPSWKTMDVKLMMMMMMMMTARNRTHNLFHPKREPIPLGQSDGLLSLRALSSVQPCLASRRAYSVAVKPRGSKGQTKFTVPDLRSCYIT